MSNPLESYGFYILDMAEQESKPKVTKYPVKEYDIWSEGYAITGNSSDAVYFGKSKGRNFQDACMRYFMRSELESRIQRDNTDEYFNTARWDYDASRNCLWGCRLFETEEEARKLFG